MRRVAGLALVSLLAGCLQADPGEGEGFEGTCPSWVRMPQGGQVVTRGPIFLFDNNTQGAPEFEKWDFMGPTYDDQGNPTKRGNGIGDGYLQFDGHPLDQLVIDLRWDESKRGLYVQNAEVHLQFIAARDGYPAEAMQAWDQSQGRASAKHEWVFTSPPGGYAFHNVTLRLDLAEPGAEPDPHGVFLYWTWVPRFQGQGDVPSVVIRGYTPEYWYRTCSSDGTKV